MVVQGIVVNSGNQQEVVSSNTLFFDTKQLFPEIGEVDKVYISKDNGISWTWSAIHEKYLDNQGRVGIYKAILTENINNEIVSDIVLSTFSNVNIYANIIDFNFEKQYIFESNDINDHTIISINDTEIEPSSERYDLKLFNIDLLGITKSFQFGYYVQGFSLSSMGKNMNKVSISIEVYP